MQLVTENIWSQISQSARESSKSYVAVAYLGKGAFDQLPLPTGSVLVVDASNPSVIAGTTNPFEILRYLDSGVKVFSQSGLHAKVYVFDSRAWVGSANASENSRVNLIECMAFSQDSSVVKGAIEFVKSHALNPVTPNYAKYLTTIYKPPRLNNKAPENTLWLQKLVDYEYTASEKDTHNVNASRLESELESVDYFVDSVRYRPRDTFARKSVIGDTLIRIKGKWVYAPNRVLGKATSYIDDSVLIFIEDKESARRMRLSTFEARLKKIGISLRSREYPKKTDIKKILQLWCA